jgi:uncharacterized protein (DUF433 family)
MRWAVPQRSLDAYPRLTEDDVRACLAYAADTVANKEVYSLSSD